MNAVVRLASAICRVLALIGAAGVVAMMVHIGLDVLLRSVFGITLHVTTEMVARYYMVAIAFLPLGWLEMRREMVSVELLDFVLRPRLRELSDALACLFSAAVYAALAYATWPAALSNMRAGTYVELATWKMAVWHSYFLPPAGFAVAALACLTLSADLLRADPASLAARLSNEDRP